MHIEEICLNDGLTHIALVGKLDMPGLHAVDIKFHGYTAARRRPTLVDLARLEFIASLGIGMLVSCAQSLRRHEAKMVLLNAHGMVLEALRAVGIDQAIPIVNDADEAMKILQISG